MSQKTAAADQAVKFSRKCSECGLRNFVEAKVCRRCDADLLSRSAGAKKVLPVRESTNQARQSKAGRILIFVAAAAILSVMLLFYVRRVPQGTETLAGPVNGAESAKQSEHPVQDTEQNAVIQDDESEEPAKQVLAGLKHFQETPKLTMTYEEYDQMLANLKADLNNTLPAFDRHQPSDERFRKEVAAALRDYTAAGNWWKTTIRNSKVLNDSDRTTRLQVEWGSAQAHLDNAEKQLVQ